MKDEIYKNKLPEIKQFDFTQEVAQVFDDMAGRSIPFYHLLNEAIISILEKGFPSNTVIYDVGCSTGTLLSMILAKFDIKKYNTRLVGIDKSPSMIEQAKSKTEGKVELICADFLDPSTVLENSSFIISNFTMQFLPPALKPLYLQKLSLALQPGGKIVLCEKLECSSSMINELFIDIYHDFKAKNGYSQLEINQKRDALKNVLCPLSEEGLYSLLRQNGFAGKGQAETFFRWFNFAGILGVK